MVSVPFEVSRAVLSLERVCARTELTCLVEKRASSSRNAIKVFTLTLLLHPHQLFDDSSIQLGSKPEEPAPV